MSSNRTNNNTTGNNNHRRQWSEGVMSTERSNRIYKDDDRLLIQHLVNEYLLEGSNEVLELIRNCPNECFEALVDFFWHAPSQTPDTNEEDLYLYNQRTSLLSSTATNVYRYHARRRLAILFIEICKLLSIPILYNGRFDFQRQNRLLHSPAYIRQIINFEPDIQGLSCLVFASILLINPLILHHQIHIVIDALKHASNQFVKANFSFETPSIYAISIYSLFYLLYILYPNILRRDLQPDMTHHEKPLNQMGIERILLPLFNHFKLHRNIVCGTIDNEKHENRWQNDSWQSLIANGDRYVILDDVSILLKRKDDKSNDTNRFEIDQLIRMCNEYTESVLHPSEIQSQIVQNQYGKKHSNDSSSNYSGSDSFVLFLSAENKCLRYSLKDSHCQTYEQQWQTTIQNGHINLSRCQTTDESNTTNTIDQNIHSKVQLQLDMLDCNYEQDKREYYAQLIRDIEKHLPIHDLDKQLKAQEMQYQEWIHLQKQKTSSIDDIRKRTNDFYQLNETFHNSLSATQVELKTDEDEHWQQHSSFKTKYSTLKYDIQQLEEMKLSIENEIRDIQRRLFQSKTDAEQSLEISQIIEKLYLDLACARKKHQLLHHALVNMKLKSTNSEKLLIIYQNNDEQNNSNIDEKKQKFEQFKYLLDKQQTDLTIKRNNFNQLRNMNTHKINTIRRQIDSIRICQTQLNMNSQILPK